MTVISHILERGWDMIATVISGELDRARERYVFKD